MDSVWEHLTRGVHDRRHGFHLPAFVTVTADGMPDGRTVVLRHADRGSRTLACHSDARSPKVRQVVESGGGKGGVMWVLYDSGKRVQVRAWGRARVERPDADEAAAEAWERTGEGSRRCYLAPSAPTVEVDGDGGEGGPSANLPEAFRVATPTRAESEAGRANFCRVVTVVDRLEWLMLRHDGHRRARFTWRHGDAAGGGEWAGVWIEP